MTTPKRILIAAIHYPVASGRYIARAFKRLGHDVRTVGPCTLNQVWGITVEERHIWTPDYLHTIDNKMLAKHDDDWQPDLTICADSAYMHPTFEGVKLPVPLVVWGVDNHVRNYDLGVQFDHYFLAHHDGPVLPVDESRSDMTWLPCAYDPEYFTPSPIPMAEREYDVCMIGVAYPKRVEIINAMREAGLKVFAATGLLYEDYAKAYHNSRISLCVSAAGDVAQRVFETAAMGCVILTDPCADFERLGFHSQSMGSSYISVKHAVDLALYITERKGLMAEVAELSQQWAAPHTWDARAQVVLDTMFGQEA